MLVNQSDNYCLVHVILVLLYINISCSLSLSLSLSLSPLFNLMLSEIYLGIIFLNKDKLALVFFPPSLL